MSEFDCRRCGACCISWEDQETYCDVLEADKRRLSKSFVEKNIIDGAIRTKWKQIRSGPLRGFEMNSCAALRGSVMHRVCCSIYENRPKTCRVAVKPGDRVCKEIRRVFFEAISLRTPRAG